jgi:hypothetical protein
VKDMDKAQEDEARVAKIREDVEHDSHALA